MKKLIALLILVISTNLFAVSSSITLTSDYVSRGVSLGAPAVQGSLGQSFETGFSVLAWASNIESGQELDLSAGYSKSISENYSVHTNLIWYDYTKTPGINYLEYHLGLTRGNYNFEVYYAPESNNIKKNAVTYFELNGSYDLTSDVAFAALMGYSAISKEELADQKDGAINYQIGFNHKTSLMDVGIFYSDSTREDQLGQDQHDQSVFFKGSKNF